MCVRDRDLGKTPTDMVVNSKDNQMLSLALLEILNFYSCPGYSFKWSKSPRPVGNAMSI